MQSSCTDPENFLKVGGGGGIQLRTRPRMGQTKVPFQNPYPGKTRVALDPCMKLLPLMSDLVIKSCIVLLDTE